MTSPGYRAEDPAIAHRGVFRLRLTIPTRVLARAPTRNGYGDIGKQAPRLLYVGERGRCGEIPQQLLREAVLSAE